MASTTKKRIRSSLERTATKQPVIVKSERKTRSMRHKENYDELTSDIDNKKHYVMYPGTDEENNHENEAISTRVLRRHTLKEQNINVTKVINSESAVKKHKNTCKSKKMLEEPATDLVTLETEVKSKGKKNKKKTQIAVQNDLENNDEILKESTSNTNKKSKKKKNTKRPSSNGTKEIAKDPILNASMDSFHSAAGSLSNEKFNGFDKLISEAETEINNPTEILQSSNKKFPLRLSTKKKSNLVKNADIASGINKDNFLKFELKTDVNDTCNITNNISEYTNNCNESCKDTLNCTYEETNLNNSVLVVNNSNVEMVISGGKRKSMSRNSSINGSSFRSSLDNSYEKCCGASPNKIISLDLIVEKENEANLTFDEDKRTPSVASNAVNITFDKSNGSHLSISSNDSRIDNLASPILIDCSMNVPNIINTSKKQEMTDKEIPVMSLKRESTYIKESTGDTRDLYQLESNTSDSSDHRVSLDRTPKRRKSLPSPGCTPFVGAKSEKGKVVLNLTHSIEKPTRRSSLFEPITKATKVMFCSPVNNPIAASQGKSKMIKSSLKGSNKSFLFNDNLFETKRPGTRKRSFTQNDVEDMQRKRVRLGNEMQQSVDRLSRPRTVSAAAKISEPLTPSKRTTTPVKVKPDPKLTRTKLPNFRALHQKRFDKMESLDECQERKAKRARQLLTPTGSINLLERISPKDNVPDSTKAAPKETRKADTPCRPKPLTLESLNPGYTRFGFKMNCAVNPFSASAKHVEVKTRKTDPGLTKQSSRPSLTGATTVKRLSAVKQRVMRQRTFNSKREAERNENRTIIKGVRTNRRFDLQMKMRNIN